MLSVLEIIQRTNCVICNINSNSILCQACKNETRDDFYLLLLTKIKDECENYDNLKTECIDLQDAIKLHPVPDHPTSIFDENMHLVDKQAKHLLDDYTELSNHDVIPVDVVGDGDCMFHAIHVFYPTMSIEEIRCRCLIELCTHEQYYDTIRMSTGLDLVDDECVQDHVTRILNNNQYTGILTLAALANVLNCAITSVYPKVNDIDAYSDVLNTTFFPRETQNSELQAPIHIMWSGPDNDIDRDWRANHFVPLMVTKKASLPSFNTVTIEDTFNDTSTTKSTPIISTRMRPRVTTSKVQIEKENIAVNEEYGESNRLNVGLGVRNVFLEAPLIIEQVLNAVKEHSIAPEPPKMIISPSIYIVKFTEENRSSITKDGNGVWIQNSSCDTHFVLTKNNNYQIVRSDSQGQFYYNMRSGSIYAAHFVDKNSIITLKRVYATNKADSSFRRMICYLIQTVEDSSHDKLPMFLQYVRTRQWSDEKLVLSPHGNSTKSRLPFTSTVPSVLEKIKSYSKSTKPSTIYTNELVNIDQSSNPILSTVRNKAQIYNARNTRNSNIEEYIAVMKRLENQNSIVARFSMSRLEAPVVILSQKHLIQEMKRCCINTSSEATLSILCIDTTFNLGKFFVTPTTFQNQALRNRKNKQPVITLGPTMIHYREDSQSYQELLEFLRHEMDESVPKVFGSDGAKSILNAISSVFPNSVHLVCTRHVRKNIERYLIKSRATIDQRRTLLQFIFDSHDALVQSKTEEEFEERMDILREIAEGIRNEDNHDENSPNNFFNWFERYQSNVFRQHMLASVRLQLNYVDISGDPRLYYNNDVEAMNHVLKVAANWEIKSLSDVIDIIDRVIMTQKNDLIRSLYDAGDWKLVPPYTRFLHDPRIWTLKTIQERNAVINNYYSFIPGPLQTANVLNIPRQAGKKPNRQKSRSTSAKTRKNK